MRFRTWTSFWEFMAQLTVGGLMALGPSWGDGVLGDRLVRLTGADNCILCLELPRQHVS